MNYNLLCSMRSASSPALNSIFEPRFAQAELSQNEYASPMKEVPRSRQTIRSTSVNRPRPEVERRDSLLDVNITLHRSLSSHGNFLQCTTVRSTDQIVISQQQQQQQAEPEPTTYTSSNLASASPDNTAPQGNQRRIRGITGEAAQNVFCLPICGYTPKRVRSESEIVTKERRGKLPSSWMPCAAAKEDAEVQDLESEEKPTGSVRKSSMRQKLFGKLSQRYTPERGPIPEVIGPTKLPSMSYEVPIVDVTSYEPPTYSRLPSNVFPICKRNRGLTKTSLQPREETSGLSSNNDNGLRYGSTSEWPLVSAWNEQVVRSISISSLDSELPNLGASTEVKEKKEEKLEDGKQEIKVQEEKQHDEQGDADNKEEDKQENDRNGHANDKGEDEDNEDEAASTSTTDSKENTLMDSWRRIFKAFPISDNENNGSKLLRAAIENFDVLTLPVPRNIIESTELTERRRTYLTAINLTYIQKELKRLLPIWADTFRIVVNTHENDVPPPDWLLACHTAKLCLDMRRLIRRFKHWNYKIGECRNLLEDFDWDHYDPEALAKAQPFDPVVLENELQTMERLAGSLFKKGNSAIKTELVLPVHDTSAFCLKCGSSCVNATWHIPTKEIFVPLTKQVEKQISLPSPGESPIHRRDPATLQPSTLEKVRNHARPTSISSTPWKTSSSAFSALRKAPVQKRQNIPEDWINIQNQSHMQNEVRLGTRFKHPPTIVAPLTVPKDSSIGNWKGLFNKETFNPPTPSKPSPEKASSLSKATPPGNHSRASNPPVSANISPISRLTPRNFPVQPAVLTQQMTNVGPSSSRPRKPPVPSRFITRNIIRPASRTPTQSTIRAQTPKNIGARQTSISRTRIPIWSFSRNASGSSASASQLRSSSNPRIVDGSRGLPTPHISSNLQVAGSPRPTNPTPDSVAQSSIPWLLRNGRSGLTGGDSPFSSISRRRLATMARRLKEEEELMEAAMENQDGHQ